MHEKICDIQNSFWKAYTVFRKTRDMKQYNMDIDKIIEKYRYGDRQYLTFCQNLVVAWTPIINGIKGWS